MTISSLSFQFLRFTVLAAAVLVVAFFGAVFAMFPGQRHAADRLPVISAEETEQTLAALKPPKRARPVIAIVGANEGTETTDYLVPYGVLKRSGIADVLALGTKPGPMMMMPALTVIPDATTDEFDRRYPEGADFVIVPALHDSANPVVRDFIKAQAAAGATIISICDGTLVLANAGLLDGRSATGHWFAIDGVCKAHPGMRYVRDRRYVVDRGVGTTTGISASVPLSLTLIEAIAGRERADAIAREVGAPGWSAAHDSGAFHLIRADVFSIAANLLTSLWHRDTVGVRVADGVDVIALAFTADSFTRTYRSGAVAIGAGRAPIKTLEGLQIVADGSAGEVDFVVDLPGEQPARAVDLALREIATRYGRETADMVRLQLEYPEASNKPVAAVTAAQE